MSDIETLTNALASIDVNFTVRTDGDYQYLYIGDRRNIYDMSEKGFVSFANADIERLKGENNFSFDFENGELVSYSNS